MGSGEVDSNLGELDADVSTESEVAPHAEADVAEGHEPSGPGGARLAIISIAAFLGLVLAGGGVGWLIGAASPSVVAGPSVQSGVDPVEIESDAPEEIAFGETGLPLTSFDSPAPETEPAAPSGEIPESLEQAIPPLEVSPSVEVQSVVELGLPLSAEPTTTEPEATEPADDVEFLELPKAVYDRIDLTIGDVHASNVADNDEIGGVFRSVQLTGLGELAPGFVLAPTGTLSGEAVECGNWRAQYALISTNPATGTSWIEIDVSGCGESG